MAKNKKKEEITTTVENTPEIEIKEQSLTDNDIDKNEKIELEEDNSENEPLTEKEKKELEKLDNEILTPIFNEVVKGLEEDKLEETMETIELTKYGKFPLSVEGKSVDVLNFMTSMEQYIAPEIGLPSVKNINLRRSLALEELSETEEAFKTFLDYGISKKGKTPTGELLQFSNEEIIKMTKEIYDGVIDQIFVLYGSIITYGLLNKELLNELEEAFIPRKRVDISNYDFSHTSATTIELKSELSKIREHIEFIYSISIDVKLRNILEYSNNDDKSIFESINLSFNKMFINIVTFANKLGILNKNIFDDIWAEIYTSNMTKLDGYGKPVYNDAGKVIKSWLYEAPKLEPIIEQELYNNEL